jgi:hypothetical protein
MRRRRAIVLFAATFAMFVPVVHADAASPGASCPGQELSTLGPELGSDLGAFISFEARHPELEGRKSFGVEVSGFAHADRSACPEE